MSISRHYLSTVALALALLLAALAADHLVLAELKSEALRDAVCQQERGLETFRELLKAKGEGFRSAGGKLFAGSYLINGNNEIPDRLLALTGSRATVFLGATRIATNVPLQDGERALGTRLTGPAYRALFQRGSPYRGEAPILGVPYFTAYDPIRDGGGRVIGALFVGVKEGDYLAGYRRTAFRIRTINLALSSLVLLFGWLILRERRLSEERLQKQLDFLQVLSDTIPSPIFSKGRDLRYTGCNRAFLSLVGLSREQVMGRTVQELWPGELAAHYDPKDQELMGSDSPTQLYEAQVRRYDGALREVSFHKARLSGRDGEPDGIVGVMLDITERKAAEEALREAYQRTADILEFLPDGAFVVDRENRVIAWNRAIEEMTGVAKGEILGRGGQAYSLPFYGEPRDMLIDLLDADAGLLDERYENGRREGRVIFGEIRMPRYRGGEDRILRAAAAPLFDREGRRSGGIQTVRDVSELRRATQQKQMLEAQREYARMIEALLVQLGHDLKTPLTPLFALLPLLQRGVTDPGQRRMLELCSDSAGQIHALTEKSLQLVRLSAQLPPAELVELPLRLCAEQEALRLEEGFRERGVRWENRIPAELRVPSAPEQLSLLFGNLLSNAVRYAAKGGEVSAGATADPQGVTVWVSDDGAGLGGLESELIFREFFKADRARQDLNTQGLGLAICKRIVLNHGGRIWAESPGTGGGTTVLFTLTTAAPGAAETGADRGRNR